MLKSLSFKKFVSFLLLLVIIFLIVSPAQAQISIDDARKSVVRIIALEPGWRDQAFPDFMIGSGFIIGNNEPFEYVATAFHVVNPAVLGYDNVEIFIWRSMDDMVPARIHVSLPAVDMALLRIDPAHLLYGYEPLPIGRRELVNVGDEVYAIGFPMAADVGLSDIPASYDTNTTVTKGIVSRFTTVDGTGYFQMDASVSPGNSGGPLLSSDGQVVGVVTRTAGAEGIHGAIQIDYLTDILVSRGIPFKAGGIVEPPAEPPAPPVEPPAELPAPPVEEEQGVNLIYVVLGAIALILVVAAVLLSGKSKKAAPAVASPAPRAMPAQTQAAPVTRAKPEAPVAVTQAKRLQSRAALIGISGLFAGQTLDLVNNQLIIGRDPKIAQVVFPQSSEEISRKHCTIRYDENSNKFILEDSSSNGTYLASNQKLEVGKQYYLNPGDRFYVADSRELFEVKLNQ